MYKTVPFLFILLLMSSLIACSASARQPERGNFVPVDLDIVGHPFVEQLERQPNFYRGQLLEEGADHWKLLVYLPDAQPTIKLDKAALDLPQQLLVEGTPVILQASPDEPERFIFISHNRVYRYSLLIIISLILCMLAGGWPTLRGLLGLALGTSYFFYFLLPRIQTGSPIILEIGIFYLLVSCLVLPSALGFNRKALSAIFTTLATGVVALIILAIFTHLLSLSGLSDDTVQTLDYARRYFPEQLADINFFALFIGGALIGILGLVLDVAVDINSSAAEISTRRKELPFSELLKRTTTVSRRLLGTMCNTLLLAYLGTDLLLFFSLYLFPESLRSQLNRELIASSLVRSFGGALGFILAVPLALGFYAFLFRPSPDVPSPPADPEQQQT